MEGSTGPFRQFAQSTKVFALRLLSIGQIRLELLSVELQEERDRLLHTLLLSLTIAVCGLMGALTATATLVVYFWDTSPTGILLALTALYGSLGLFLILVLKHRLRHWHVLEASIEQLRQDRASLEKILQ
jgi:uncharacterized membrane protein YqjE